MKKLKIELTLKQAVEINNQLALAFYYYDSFRAPVSTESRETGQVYYTEKRTIQKENTHAKNMHKTYLMFAQKVQKAAK